MDRRKFVAYVASAGVVTIAGCSGGSENTGGENGQDESENTEPKIPEASGNSAATPQQAAQEYYTAIAESNPDGANNYIHPTADMYPVDEDYVPNRDISVRGGRQVTAEDVVRFETPEEIGLNNTELNNSEFSDDIQRFRRMGEEALNKTKATDYAFSIVSYQVDIRGGEAEQEEALLLLAENDGWYVYETSISNR